MVKRGKRREFLLDYRQDLARATKSEILSFDVTPSSCLRSSKVFIRENFISQFKTFLADPFIFLTYLYIPKHFCTKIGEIEHWESFICERFIRFYLSTFIYFDCFGEKKHHSYNSNAKLSFLYIWSEFLRSREVDWIPVCEEQGILRWSMENRRFHKAMSAAE